jgi:hypothetical protein
MTVTNPAAKILNKAYCRHSIKIAQGHRSRPAANSIGTNAKPQPASTTGPGIGPAFGGGMLQGAKNIIGGVGSAAVGVKDMAYGVGEATVGPTLRNFGDSVGSWLGGDKSLNELNPRWQAQAQRAGEQDGYQMFTSGARDVAESFGQMVGVNNAWQNGQYVGAQAPQNAAQQHAARQQKYYAHTADRDLGSWNAGANDAADFVASAIPSIGGAARFGTAAARAAKTVPTINRAVNATNSAISASRPLDYSLRAGSVATGLPLHPQALAGGGLTAAIGASQSAQHAAPTLAPLAVQHAAPYFGTSQQTATSAAAATRRALAEAQKYAPAVVTDNAMRTVVPDLPEMIDAATMPGTLKPVLPAMAGLTGAAPVLDERRLTQAENEQRQLAHSAETANQHALRDHRGQLGDHAATNAMLQDPAMHNRALHGRVPMDAAVQIAEEQHLGETPEEHLQNAVAMTQNDPQTQATAEFEQAKQELTQPDFTDSIHQGYANKIQGLAANNASPDEVNSTIDEYLQYASQNTSPEEYEQVRQDVANLRTHLSAMVPEKKEQVAAAAQNPNGPEFQELTAAKEQEVGQQAVAAAQNNPDSPPPTDPQGYGKFINDTWSQAVGVFREMDPMMQLGMSLGLGTGLLGLLGGLGGDGIGTFLMGALGLGAAGFMGANAGMFGQDAQNFAKDTMFNIGAATGMIPQVKKDDLAPLLAQNAMGALSGQAPQIDYMAAATNPERYAKTIGPQVQQAEAKIKQLQQLVGLRPEQLVQITPGLSLAEAQKAIANGHAVLADAANPNGQLGAKLTQAREFMANPVAVRDRELGNAMRSGVQRITDWWKGAEDMNIAQHILMEKLITKAARCWAGYEPVPGKKPYSNDSCRPIGGKKKKKKTSVK